MNLTPEVIESHLRNFLEHSEVRKKRRFRHCAGRSLMILRSYREEESQQATTNWCNDINYCKRGIIEEFPVLKEARREVMEGQ